MIVLVPGLHFRNENHWKIDLDRFLGDSRMLMGSSWLALGCFCLVLAGCTRLLGALGPHLVDFGCPAGAVHLNPSLVPPSRLRFGVRPQIFEFLKF